MWIEFSQKYYRDICDGAIYFSFSQQNVLLFPFYQMLILQFLDYALLQLNKMNILLLYFDILASWNMFFLKERLHLLGHR